MKKLFILLSLGIILSLPGCDSGYDASNQDNVGNASHVGIITDFNNGVYYFDYTGAYFANALSQFIEVNPGLELVSMIGDGNGGYGCDIGYFVVFKKKTNQ